MLQFPKGDQHRRGAIHTGIVVVSACSYMLLVCIVLLFFVLCLLFMLLFISLRSL